MRSWPLKIYRRGSEYVLAPPPKNVTFFYSKLLWDNSASFTSSDMRQKWKVKLIFSRCLQPVRNRECWVEVIHVGSETVCRLDLTDPNPHILDRSTPLSQPRVTGEFEIMRDRWKQAAHPFNYESGSRTSQERCSLSVFLLSIFSWNSIMSRAWT